MLKKVLITKDNEELAPYKSAFLEKGYELIGEAFIEFEEVIVKQEINSEVLFFSSRRAFDFFLNQDLFQSHFKIACVGSETKKHIENLGFTVSFSGTKSGDVASVSKELNVWLNGRSITYFLSNLSKKTIDTHVESQQKTEIIIYKTILLEKVIDNKVDFLVFTSPSNVEGFLNKNSISKETKVISWGNTTTEALNKHSVSICLTLSNSSLENLLEEL